MKQYIYYMNIYIYNMYYIKRMTRLDEPVFFLYIFYFILYLPTLYL